MRVRRAVLALSVVGMSFAAGACGNDTARRSDTVDDAERDPAQLPDPTGAEAAPPGADTSTPAGDADDPSTSVVPQASSTVAPAAPTTAAQASGGLGQPLTDEQAEALNAELVEQLEGCSATPAGCAGDDLKYVTAPDAELSGRDFSDADLQGADFSGADLRGADFSGADLSGALFVGADLTGASFDGAVVEGAVFDGATVDAGALEPALRCQTVMPDGELDNSFC